MRFKSLSLIIILMLSVLALSIPETHAAVGQYHYKTYTRTVDIYSDGSYKIFEEIEILGTVDGSASIDLGSSFVIKSVKISEDKGKTWKTIPESDYIEGNLLKINVLKSAGYLLQVSGQGTGAKTSFTTSLPSGIDQSYVRINLKIEDGFITSSSPMPYNEKTDKSVEWSFTDRNAHKYDVSFGALENDAKLDVSCNALILIDSENKMKMFCGISAEGLINRLEIALPEGMEFTSFGGNPVLSYPEFEVESENPLVIKKLVPSSSFNIMDLEIRVKDTITSMPSFINSKSLKYNIALYSSEKYRLENKATTFTTLTKYEADFLSSISGFVPENYNLDSLYTGKSAGSLSFEKVKLTEKEHLATNINSANYDIFPTKRGFAIVKANYQVVNSETGKYLELELPENAVFWGAIVNSEPEKAYGEGRMIQIPLPVSEKYGSNYQAQRVTIFYIVTKEVFKGDIYSTYNLILPSHKAPVTNMYIKIGLPEGFVYWKTDVAPEMEAELITYQPKKIYYDRMIDFNANAGASEMKATASQIEQMSLDAPVQRVQLSFEGAPVTVQIPEMTRYVQITGGGESIIMPEETVSIAISGLESSGMYIIYAGIGIVLLGIIILKRKKIKEILW